MGIPFNISYTDPGQSKPKARCRRICSRIWLWTRWIFFTKIHHGNVFPADREQRKDQKARCNWRKSLWRHRPCLSRREVTKGRVNSKWNRLAWSVTAWWVLPMVNNKGLLNWLEDSTAAECLMLSYTASWIQLSQQNIYHCAHYVWWHHTSPKQPSSQRFLYSLVHPNILSFQASIHDMLVEYFSEILERMLGDPGPLAASPELADDVTAFLSKQNNQKGSWGSRDCLYTRCVLFHMWNMTRVIPPLVLPLYVQFRKLTKNKIAISHSI